MTSLLVLMLIIILFSNHSNVSSVSTDHPFSWQLDEAANYLLERYNSLIGLVSESEDRGSSVPDETPCNRTYWVYSDNLWAQEALKPFNPERASNISETLMHYLEKCGKSQLFEVVLGENIPTQIYGGSKIFVEARVFDGKNHTIWCDRHQPQDGDIFHDLEEYADTSFYMALNYHLRGNRTASEEWFRNGEAMWRDYGFMDKAAIEDERFQNYKLGLYLFTQRVTGFISAISDDVEQVAWSYQLRNGGIATQSYFNGTTYGTANVETTSILLMAYNEQALQRFDRLTGESSFVLMWSIVVIAILLTVILSWYLISRKKS